MKFTSIPLKLSLLTTVAATSALPATLRQEKPPAVKKPNILFILADDLGYGDLGCYGQQKIETPNIDALAAKGILYTQYYAGSPVSAPSRCSLLTGLHTGRTAVRGNDEATERGDVWNFAAATMDPGLEGQQPMPANTFTLAHLLKQNGYRTACFGKWGLGYPGSVSTPDKMGFDTFYGYNCQRQAHTYFPRHLWRNDRKEIINAQWIAPHQRFPDSLSTTNESNYDRYYGTSYTPDLIFREMQAYILNRQEEPFFIFYTPTLPHVALQAPEALIDQYREKFGPEAPYTGNGGYLPHYAPRAAYAAMVTLIDRHVGALMLYLKKAGLLENTLIIFTSDNGPSDAGGSDPDFFNSTGPFNGRSDRMKGYLYEGGIRVPLIAYWQGRIVPGSISNHLCSSADFFNAFRELTASRLGLPQDELLASWQGKSNTRRHLYFELSEYGGQQAVRMADWKGIRTELHKAKTPLQLYNLCTDPGEQFDVAAQYPSVVAAIERIMQQEHQTAENPRFRLKGID